MRYSLPCLLLLMLAVACTPSVPSQYLQPDEMEDLLYDYHIGQALAKADGHGDETNYKRNLYFQSVLEKHHLTEADYDSSMVYYFSHLDRLRDIYKRVNERLSDEAKMLGAAVADAGRYTTFSATGDTANIWSGPTDLVLIPRPTMNRLDFTIPVDTAFYKGDSFSFQFLSEFLWQSGSRDATVCIVSKYEGDSIIQTVNHVSVSGIVQVRVPANRSQRLKAMDGFIYLSDGGDDSDTRRLMFISQLQLIRFHNKEIAHEESKPDTLKTDSLQRGLPASREAVDTMRAGNVARRVAPSADPAH